MAKGLEEAFDKKVDALKIATVRRHIFLCAGDKCCKEKDGLEVWSYLKGRLKDLSFEAPGLFRTKVACLRVCMEGPIAVVYPEGTWYRKVDVKMCERIIQEHLIGGRVVPEACFAQNTLQSGPLPPAAQVR